MAQIPVVQTLITEGWHKGQKMDDTRATLQAITEALWPQSTAEVSWYNVTIDGVEIEARLPYDEWHTGNTLKTISLWVDDNRSQRIRRAVKVENGLIDLDKVKAKHTELAALAVQFVAQRKAEKQRLDEQRYTLDNLRAQAALPPDCHIAQQDKDTFSLELRFLSALEVIAIAQKLAELRKKEG